MNSFVSYVCWHHFLFTSCSSPDSFFHVILSLLFPWNKVPFGQEETAREIPALGNPCLEAHGKLQSTPSIWFSLCQRHSTRTCQWSASATGSCWDTGFTCYQDALSAKSKTWAGDTSSSTEQRVWVGIRSHEMTVTLTLPGQPTIAAVCTYIMSSVLGWYNIYAHVNVCVVFNLSVFSLWTEINRDKRYIILF